MSGPTRLSARRAITLVARREFVVQVVKKSFLISNVVVVLAIVGGIVAFGVFSGDDEGEQVGLVDRTSALADQLRTTGEALGTPVETTVVADEADARARVEDGDLEVVLLPAGGGGVVAVTGSELEPELRAVIDATVSASAQRTALEDAGVDPDEVAARVAEAGVGVDALDPPDPDSGQRTFLAFTAVILMFGQLIGFGTYVAMGVVEEKSSRVVELLLSTIRPLHLLWGKIIGIGLVGLLQLVVYGGAGLVAGTLTGVLTITGAAVGVFLTVLGWFVLGFALFAVLYAAAGSMVSRQEDVNSTTGPLLLLIFAMYGVGFAAVGDPDGTLSSTLSWVPPFSAVLMPLRVAAGVAPVAQVVGTVVLMLVVTALLAGGASKVYQRSVLRTGSQVGWREALGMARRGSR